jgi:histidinol-phosphate aminotransferase
MTSDVQSSGALRLHYNENTAGCSPAVRAALTAVTREATALYPDYATVTTAVEDWFEVPAGAVQLTNGLDEGILLTAVVGALHGGAVAGAAEIIIPEPAFEVYEEAANIVGARIVRVPPGEDFAFPTNQVLGAITPRTRVIFLTDPNNPTGLPIPEGVVARIAAAAPDALVLVDEAYADFSGRTLIGPLLDEQRNLIVGRTFAKAHGLAGLRIGALVAAPSVIARLREFHLPFTVNVFAATALAAALDDRGYLEWYVAQAAESRRLVEDFCLRHELKCWPSDGNFVLVRVGPDASAIVEALSERGILLRDKSRSRWCEGCIRITTGVVDHTTAALTALEDALAPRTR